LTNAGYKRPGIVQLRGAHELPPLEGVNLIFTRFNKANSDVFFLYIAGFTGRLIFNIRKEKNQDVSEK
jgi:hypothetical protein